MFENVHSEKIKINKIFPHREKKFLDIIQSESSWGERKPYPIPSEMNAGTQEGGQMEKAEECFYFSVHEQQAEPLCCRDQAVPTASGTAVGRCLAPGVMQGASRECLCGSGACPAGPRTLSQAPGLLGSQPLTPTCE